MIIRANGLRHHATRDRSLFRLACDDTLVMNDNGEARPCRVCFPGEYAPKEKR